MNNKSIDINQRIPLETLYAALESYLNGSYSDEYILEQLSLEFDGENRLKKALRIVNKIIQKNPLNNFLDANCVELKNAIKKKTDRNIILISLLNIAFPFSFDILKIFGKFFLVQEIINRETITRSISNIYGGNRSTANAIDSVVPMLIEAEFFTRLKPGVYQIKDKFNITSSVTKQIYIESFKFNNALEVLQEYQLRDPYFLFIND
ncbi:MAG: hypothetical protein ACOYOV_12120 [Bacteroidales bacterium]